MKGVKVTKGVWLSLAGVVSIFIAFWMAGEIYGELGYTPTSVFFTFILLLLAGLSLFLYGSGEGAWLEVDC